MPIEAEDIVPLLLAACPSASALWRGELDWWEGETQGHYNVTGVFARHVVSSFSQNQLEELPAFFDLVERLITHGSESVRGLAIVGLLESIRNIASHESFGPEPFKKFLMPQSKAAWLEIEAAWNEKQTLADVIRVKRNNA